MEDKVVEAFEFGTAQDCLNLKTKLDENNISWEEFTAWVEEKRKTYSPTILLLRRKCPACESWLKLGRVNHTPGAMVDGDWKCQWTCMKCEYEEFSQKEIQEEAKPYIEEVQHGNR